MRWNGTDITGVPTLIYHDELITSTDDVITDPDGQGSLICYSTAGTVVWVLVPTTAVPTKNTGNFKQTKNNNSSQLTLGGVPLTQQRTDAVTNGLWSCRASTTQSLPRLFVGLYGRVQGKE